MLFITEESKEGLYVSRAKIEGYDTKIMAQHAQILDDAGLIVAKIEESDNYGITDAFIYRLTWDGHEFLDAARNDTIWKNTLKQVKEKAGSVTFELLKTLLVEGTKELIRGA